LIWIVLPLTLIPSSFELLIFDTIQSNHVILWILALNQRPSMEYFWCANYFVAVLQFSYIILHCHIQECSEAMSKFDKDNLFLDFRYIRKQSGARSINKFDKKHLSLLFRYILNWNYSLQYSLIMWSPIFNIISDH
jgi:hypothetical protein